MPYNQGTKYSVGRTKLTNYSVPDPNPSSEGGNINVPRVLFYNNGVRSVPIMHRAFRNLEIKYANALVADAMDYRGVSAGDLRVLDIGYGLGYSTQKFFELGVGTYHCLEINDTVYWNDAVNHDYFQGGLGAVNGDYSMIYDSWENYADGYEVSDRNPGYDIIYYSPCDDFGNMDIFNRLRRVSKKGTILGVQGIPLFSGVSVGNFVNSTPLGLAPDSDTYDSSFTVGMYNALNSIGYFSIYYQYLDCSGGGGDANADMGGDYLGDGSVCNNGTWINERPRL